MMIYPLCRFTGISCVLARAAHFKMPLCRFVLMPLCLFCFYAFSVFYAFDFVLHRKLFIQALPHRQGNREIPCHLPESPIAGKMVFNEKTLKAR